MRECDSPAGHLDAKSRASPRPAGPSPASLACPGALSPSPTSAPQSRGPALSRSGEPCSLLTDRLQATGSHPAAPRHHCRLSATPHRLALPGPAPGQPGPDAMPHPYPQRPTLDVSTSHPRTKRGPRRASRSSLTAPAPAACWPCPGTGRPHRLDRSSVPLRLTSPSAPAGTPSPRTRGRPHLLPEARHPHPTHLRVLQDPRSFCTSTSSPLPPSPQEPPPPAASSSGRGSGQSGHGFAPS